MIEFAFNSCFAKFYPYRRALLCASIWIKLDEDGKRFLAKYLERQGYKFDNHICWKLADGCCFSYSDGKLGIGTEIIEERW